jgi:manganese transport protein
VPLIRITSRRDLMGTLVNNRLTIAAASLIAALIISLNVVLLVDLAL